MTNVNVSFVLNAYPYYNKWPRVRFYNNNVIIDDVECCNTQQFDYTVNANTNTDNQLKIEFYNKSFGDNNHWDINGSIELRVDLLDIKLNNVSIEHLLPSLEFTTKWTEAQLLNESPAFIAQYNRFPANGRMNFNGAIEFNYQTPVYKFLIEKKFKKPYQHNIGEFSNLTETFHYELGNAEIAEIKKILQEHE